MSGIFVMRVAQVVSRPELFGELQPGYAAISCIFLFSGVPQAPQNEHVTSKCEVCPHSPLWPEAPPGTAAFQLQARDLGVALPAIPMTFTSPLPWGPVCTLPVAARHSLLNTIQDTPAPTPATAPCFLLDKT